MAWYARTPVRAGRQVTADLLVLAWVFVSVTIGRFVHDVVSAISTPVDAIVGQAEGIAGQLGRAGDAAGRVPLLGDDLSSPLRSVGDSSRGIAESGRETVDTINTVAGVLGVTVAISLAAGVVVYWARARIRFVLHSSAVARLEAAPGGRDLLALQALAHSTPRALTRLGPNLAARWRAGEPRAVDELADLSLRSAGLGRDPGGRRWTATTRVRRETK